MKSARYVMNSTAYSNCARNSSWPASVLLTVAVICVCVVFFFQAEDGIRDLTVTGVQTCALPILAHEGYQAAALGLRGIPGAAEAIMVERDVLLSEVTGAPVHIAHMSARASLREIGRAHV